MKVWTTMDGTEIPYSELGDNHLMNILKFIERGARNGVKVIYGEAGPDGDDCWGNVEIIKGKEVKDRYDYYGLRREARQRRLI